MRILLALLLVGCLGLQAASPTQPPFSKLELVRILNEAFVEVAEKVSPSVVVVSVRQRAGGSGIDPADPVWESLPPELRKQLERRHRVLDGQGSGIILRKDGYILTNRHVIDEAEKIRVRLHDGREFDAEVRGVDEDSDVAVLKITADGLSPARFADSDKARVGEFAIAVGAPYGLDYSVTFGHINAKGRAELDLQLMDQDFIQTDASINPGNSGGPLVNIEGEVIGMNTLIRGLRTGIGFAIPANLAREIADQIIETGRFQRPWLGVSIQSYADYAAMNQIQQPAVEKGVIVLQIPRTGPAAKSKLDLNDIITAIDGRPVGTVQQLRNEVRRKKVGQAVRLDVLREGRKLVVEVHPEEKPAQLLTPVLPGETAPPNLEPGIQVGPLSPELEKKLRTPGVLVTAVEDGSLAAEKQIVAGDVITRINKRRIRTVSEFEQAMKEADLKQGIQIYLVSEEGRRTEILKLQP